MKTGGKNWKLYSVLQTAYTLYSRFSGHQFSGLPRFSGHNSDYQIAIYVVYDHQFSGFSQFSGQLLTYQVDH